jgi:hypothetical protein
VSWVQECRWPFREPAGKNEKLETFFLKAITGEPAKKGLLYLISTEPMPIPTPTRYRV